MTDTERDQWPAVDAAYAFVLPSYQLLASRFEAADARVTTFLTIAATLTLGAPLFAKSVRPDLTLNSPIFWLSILIFVSGMIVGIIGRTKGSLMLPDPMVIHQKSLHRSECSFKMNQLFYAGEHFEFNREQIRVK